MTVRSNTAAIAASEDRYDPLPALPDLPRWLWRRTGPRLRAGVLVAFVLALAGTAVLVPAIDETRDRRAAAEQRARDALHERRIDALLAEQRPRRGRLAAASRPAALGELEGAIAADARERVRAGALNGTIRRAECEPFPRSLDPARLLARRRVRLACLAVTAEFEGGALGHPYRALVDFATGRYAYCKVSARLEPTPDPEVTTPRVCGG